MSYNAVDLFAGCGGMTEGLFQAGFRVIAAIESDQHAARTYRANNDQRGVMVFEEDIRGVDAGRIRDLLDGRPLHLLVGCPPCQGFSTIRTRNKTEAVTDPRNDLIWEYIRFAEELRPMVIMLENVPALADYPGFRSAMVRLEELGYNPQMAVADVANYGVPQRRKRLVVIASLLGDITPAVGSGQLVTVRDAIGHIESVRITQDPIHRMFPTHSAEVQNRITATPRDGGSRTDWPNDYTLKCHQREGVGFRDVYGRLSWDKVSSTITGGCLNPSKGRFLHPEEDRCISAREASMLQTFPRHYIFLSDVPKAATALMIGNALPPEFARQQATHVSRHLDGFLMSDIYDDEKRSSIMRSVKSKNTAPELAVRRLLCEMGYRYYRLKSSGLPCRPDIIFRGKRKAIFVNGCFWHGHDCPRGQLPQTNVAFWQTKIEENRSRDERNYRDLVSMGWTYLVVWQCQLKESNKESLRQVLSEFLSSEDV
jgi:DNA (cytosine-5)-methyltransferase 1